MKQEEILKIVMDYPKLKERLDHARPEDLAKVRSYFEEMAADYKPMAIKKMGFLIEMTMLRLYDHWNAELPPNMNLTQLAKDYHVVLVPNHQSHADYLIFNYILHRRFSLIPYIAGGINLNVFPVGKIFRQSGCFFIRRTFHNNILYKLTLEAYLSWVLGEGNSMEFFYEGGRSRTGKLMPPKYGLFQLILEAHRQIGSTKPIAFVPVSIAHEIVPEHKTMVREMEGAKKQKESFSQFLKLYKLLKRRFGSVHIQLGEPIFYQRPAVEEDLRGVTQRLAFRCYHAVGKGIQVNSYALLSLILLDDPSGTITWDEIVEKAHTILDYCHRFHIPCAKSLHDGEVENSLKMALELMLLGKKLKVLKNSKLDQTFYTINDSSRMDLLYSKNTILHHFVVPFLINFIWINIFNGRIKNPKDVKTIFLAQRDQLKYEFYLPTTKDLFVQGLEIIRSSTGRDVKNIEDCFAFTSAEIYSVAQTVAPFVNAFRHIYEAYYIAAETLLYFKDKRFGNDSFLKMGQELFAMERVHGRFVKHRESFTVPTIKNALAFFENKKIIVQDEGAYKLESEEVAQTVRAQYARYLTEILVFNLRIKRDKSG